MTIKMPIATIALASMLFVGALASQVTADPAIAESVTAPFDGPTPREEWGEAPMYENAMPSVSGRASRAERALEDLLPNAAYFVINLHYCSITRAPDTGFVPAGAAAIVYEKVLVGMHGGDCHTFYAGEILPRIYLSDEQS